MNKTPERIAPKWNRDAIPLRRESALFQLLRARFRFWIRAIQIHLALGGIFLAASLLAAGPALADQMLADQMPGQQDGRYLPAPGYLGLSDDYRWNGRGDWHDDERSDNGWGWGSAWGSGGWSNDTRPGWPSDNGWQNRHRAENCSPWRGPRLDRREVIWRLERQGFRRIRHLDHDNRRYKFVAVAPNGRRVKAVVDDRCARIVSWRYL